MKPSGKEEKHKKENKFIQTCLAGIVAAAVLTLAGCAGFKTTTPIPATVPEVRPGLLQGYLELSEAPNSDTLLPAPPAAGSAAFAADQEAFHSTRALISTPRWTVAIKDANLHFPEAPEAFSCALDAPITKDAMPNLYTLMHRTLTDAGYATYAAKNKYKRTRPFLVNQQTSCTPNEEAKLAKDGSYPSGHTAIGWAWALILAEIAPARADVILSRGYAFGQSRVICGVHWQSDVHAGRVIAAAVVAKLHTDPVFCAQLEEAKKELAYVRGRSLKPARDCKAEQEALAYGSIK